MIRERHVVAALPQVAPGVSWIRDYVAWAGAQTDAPLGYHLLAAVTALAPLMPTGAAIPIAGVPVRPVIYGALLGGSGERKTHSMEMVRSVMKEAGIGSIILPLDDPSREGINRELFEDNRRLAWLPEMGDFLAATVEGSYQDKLRPALTKIYDCQPLGSSRSSKAKSRIVQEPRMSLLGGCSVSYLQDYTTERDWKGGFIGRFLLMYCERERDWRIEDRQNTAAFDYLAQRLAHLRDLAGALKPCLGVTSEAEDYVRAWGDALQKSKHVREASEWVKSSINRLHTLVYRVAYLFAFDLGYGLDGPWHIPRIAMQSAVHLVSLHVVSLANISQHIVRNDFERLRRQVLDLLTPGPQTFGELLRVIEPRVSHRTLRPVVETLFMAGEIMRLEILGGITGTGVNGKDYAYQLPPEVSSDTGGQPLGEPQGLAELRPTVEDASRAI